jgi:hypothetical protein
MQYLHCLPPTAVRQASVLDPRVIPYCDFGLLHLTSNAGTGSVKKVMGPEEEELPKEEEERRMRVLAQTVRTQTCTLLILGAYISLQMLRPCVSNWQRLGSLPPYESEEERQERQEYERTKEKAISFERFLQVCPHCFKSWT